MNTRLTRRTLLAGTAATALAVHDLLLLPTTVMKATPIPPKGASPQEITRRSWEATRNTCPFNATGHPAIGIPCGMSDGLPVGLMLVARNGHDRALFEIAAGIERLFAA